MERSAPFSVSELTRHIKDALEMAFPPLWVEGEVSDFRAAASGHMYFTLKDDQARIRTVMFRREAARLPFIPADGMQVLVHARLSVYEARGEYQLIADDLEPRGLGAMRQAMERLRLKLEAEGLFAPERKRPLPLYPHRVGVVTSASGAAIRDILKVFADRDTPVNVLVSPALVQGREAPGSIVGALAALVEHGGCDVIIVGRGGGSWEDLLPFSDEKVVRAVAGCPLPVICAVGHEIDVCLCDLAADVRAPTPSAAAEMVAEGRAALQRVLSHLAHRLVAGMRLRVADSGRKVVELGSRLIHPRYLLDQGRMKLDDLSFRLLSHVRSRLERCRGELGRLSALLRSLGPQAVLERGYAVVQKQDGTVVRRPGQVREGERLDVRVAEGRIRAKVEGGKEKK
ncbi:MAG: exodeoxyribonuclease VII large subunit [bacterium]|nr:MAG: exodeoxyribonuclease VII large subunit [bacterium]